MLETYSISQIKCCVLIHVLMYQLILCTRALDRACLKFKLLVELLHYPEEDYVEDEELVSSTICPQCTY
jgi:hypothetical protein